MAEPLEICPGCRIELPAAVGTAHPYMLGSPACRRGYGELPAAQYADPARMVFHQIVVDAYAAQHPGGGDPRAIRSVGIHLLTLALFLEHGVDPGLGTRLHRRMVARPVFHRLKRPEPVHAGVLDHTHVPRSGDVAIARQRAYEWADAVWASWRPSQEVVRGWLADSGLDRVDGRRGAAAQLSEPARSQM